MLWQSRQSAWQAGWAASEASRAFLDAYGHRQVAELAEAEPGLADICRAVLRAHGSAPGADGLPYELFHLGCDFAADLVGQAFHASRLGDEWMELVLGPN
eukprot:510677-Alexandrium_andersonii.AAC.1